MVELSASSYATCKVIKSAGVAGLDWTAVHARLVEEGRFHVETY